MAKRAGKGIQDIDSILGGITSFILINFKLKLFLQFEINKYLFFFEKQSVKFMVNNCPFLVPIRCLLQAFCSSLTGINTCKNIVNQYIIIYFFYFYSDIFQSLRKRRDFYSYLLSFEDKRIARVIVK